MSAPESAPAKAPAVPAKDPYVDLAERIYVNLAARVYGSLAGGDVKKPDPKALADAIRDYARGHRAVLLANHGPVVAGTSLSAASASIVSA